jgi:hypothetical protein
VVGSTLTHRELFERKGLKEVEAQIRVKLNGEAMTALTKKLEVELREREHILDNEELLQKAIMSPPLTFKVKP